MNSITARFHNWKAEMKQALAAAKSEPRSTDPPEWFAGLAVGPAAFSRQLSQMQNSLLRANGQQPEAAPVCGAKTGQEAMG